MSKTNYIHDKAGVSEFIGKLEPEMGKLVNEIRKIILGTSKEIGEHIKWNSPAFFFSGEMKPFHPKTYKRDLVVVNLRKGLVLLIFPTGAAIQNTTGILEGNYADGRRMITFRNSAEVKARKKDLQFVINDWLQNVDR